MKSVFQKVMLSVFVMLGIAFANTASAQALNWKTEQQAESVLMNQISLYAPVLDNPQHPNYNNALQRVVYYKGILRLIYNGNAVSVSTEKALVEASGALNPREGNTATAAPKAELQTLYNETVVLLTN